MQTRIDGRGRLPIGTEYSLGEPLNVWADAGILRFQLGGGTAVFIPGVSTNLPPLAIAALAPPGSSSARAIVATMQLYATLRD